MTKTTINTNAITLDAATANSLNPVQLNHELDSLIDARQAWETGSYKKSNDELYGILDRCYHSYQQIKGNRKLIKKLNEKLASQGVKVREGTDLATKIVRCVFGDCGKKAFTYARVIKTADLEKDDKQTLPAFIAAAGGIEEIRKGYKPGELKSHEKRAKLIEAAEERLSNSTPILSDVKLPKARQPDNDNGLHMTAVLYRKGDDGKDNLVYISTSATIINTLLAASERDAIAAAKNATAVAAPAKAAKSRASTVKKAAANHPAAA